MVPPASSEYHHRPVRGAHGRSKRLRSPHHRRDRGARSRGQGSAVHHVAMAIRRPRVDSSWEAGVSVTDVHRCYFTSNLFREPAACSTDRDAEPDFALIRRNKREAHEAAAYQAGRIYFARSARGSAGAGAGKPLAGRRDLHGRGARPEAFSTGAALDRENVPISRRAGHTWYHAVSCGYSRNEPFLSQRSRNPSSRS